MKSINEIKSEAWNTLTDRKWFGPIIVSVFNVFLTLMVGFLAITMGTNNYYMTLLIEFMLYACIAVPFSMGVSVYMLKFVRGEEVSVGNVFDGYIYALKLIPVAVIMLALSAATDYIVGLSIVNPENALYMGAGVLVSLLSAFIGIVIKFTYYLMYDNDGNLFASLKASLNYMLGGGIWKYLGLMFSFILWVFAIPFTFGMLAFMVLPYMETAATIFYEEIDL